MGKEEIRYDCYWGHDKAKLDDRAKREMSTEVDN
jgi:hypothetical protein